jgi:hypothetical protein
VANKREPDSVDLEWGKQLGYLLLSEPQDRRSALVILPGEEPRHPYGSEHMFCVGRTRMARIEYIVDESGMFVFAVWPFGREIFTHLVSFYPLSWESGETAKTTDQANQINSSELPLCRQLCDCDQLGFLR